MLKKTCTQILFCRAVKRTKKVQRQPVHENVSKMTAECTSVMRSSEAHARENIKWIQEIIKVREWIPHISPLAKVIRLKLFLDIVPSSFANITRALRGCFPGGSVCVSFRFVLKQIKASNSVKMSSLIFWLQAKEPRPSVCCNTFRNFNGSLCKEGCILLKQ